MNRRIRSWQDVVLTLLNQPTGSVIRVRKGLLPHPRTDGMSLSLGLPQGQSSDYRRVLRDGSGFHVRDFGRHYEAHIDQVHPEVNLYEHMRRDAPGTFVASGVALGAAIGGALGKDSGSAVVGGLIGGLLAAMASSEE